MSYTCRHETRFCEERRLPSPHPHVVTEPPDQAGLGRTRAIGFSILGFQGCNKPDRRPTDWMFSAYKRENTTHEVLTNYKTDDICVPLRSGSEIGMCG